ncbi:MFS transporter [Frankia sp. CNm7]|uniref:MFS transporter n=1 Tax=Frankia nepalensis TaxID=1836974 RepID=A0A937R9H1_9ACTN|nr:MFS transporter [Frankia nepalensis]MBL7501681.1 MFS transporter [Frankia nepalensis]MBL7513405.1 MFS transporter [Frankia nepalensis]MBL7523331.1 MFS transporter [Frankia nepalensis]MBL7626345.1 MFS transporter [Frankia nepalensis]
MRTAPTGPPSAAPAVARARPRWPVLGRSAGLAVAVYAFAVTMAGTTLPTPLYPGYQAEFGFSQLMVTVIFATYAVGVIVALLLFGRLSDRIGRRATLLPGLALSAASAVVFLLAGGVGELLVGRVLSGLSAGIFTGTATAAIVDLAPPGRAARAALLATVANMGGLGLGPLTAGLVARFGDEPLRLTFVVDLVALAPAVIGVLLMPETVPPAARGRAAGSGPLVSRPRVPAAARGVFVRAALAGFAGFAVLGMFTAVGPAFLGRELGVHSPLAPGLLVGGVFAASATGQLVARRAGPAVGLPTGAAGLVIGVAATALGLLFSSLTLLVVGGLLAGAAQGLSFASGLGALLGAAPPTARAETSSAFFVVAYVALSLPVVGIGVLAQLTTLRTAGLAFTAAVALLALTVLALLRRSAGRAPTSPPAAAGPSGR